MTLAVPMGWMPEAHMGTGQWAGPVCMARGCIRGEGVQLLWWQGDTPATPEDKTERIWGQEAPEDRGTQADRGEGSEQGHITYEACGGTPPAPPDDKTERDRDRPRRE